MALWGPLMCSLACTSQGAGDLPARPYPAGRDDTFAVSGTVLFHQMQDFTLYKRLLLIYRALFATCIFKTFFKSLTDLFILR